MAILRGVTGVALTILMSVAGAPMEATRKPRADCVARLDGSAFPQLIPEYWVWEELFARVQSGKETSTLAQLRTRTHLSEGGTNLLASTSSAALRRVELLRSSTAPTNGVSRNALVADALLDSRDELLRSLSDTDVQSLIEHIGRRRREMLYAFAKPRRRADDETQRVKCRMSVSGKADAELIPEAYYWEFHLRVLASISETRRLGPDKYDADYIDALRQQSLPIPETDVLLVLKTAIQTIAEVDGLRVAHSASLEGGIAIEMLVANAVQSARVTLLRRLSSSSWSVVQRHAASRRAGIAYDFPTSF